MAFACCGFLAKGLHGSYRMTSSGKRILWIKIGPLHPLDSGGKIRSYNMLKEWHRRHHITYIALVDKSISSRFSEMANSYSSRQVWSERKDKKPNPLLYTMDLLNNFLFSSLPYIVFKYRDKNFQNKIRDEVKNSEYDIILVDFLQVSSNIIDLGDVARKAILFEYNVESLIWKRHADQARNFLIKAYLNSQWRRCRDYEKFACESMAGVIAVSKDDADYFRKEMSLSNVLGDVSTGVDIEFFCPVARSPDSDNIVFLGSMDWMPNIEGIVEFVEQTLPLIRLQLPDVSVTVVGRNPTDRVKKLAKVQGVKITGTVDDVRPYLNLAALSVVPLNVGSGTRIKIYELMAAKVPVVSTTIGAEGLPVKHNESILLANKPEAFAAEVIRLMKDESLQDKISRNAFNLVRDNFTWEKVVDQFEKLCNQAVE